MAEKNKISLNEKKILRQIKLIPVLILVLSFTISTKLILDEHKDHLEREIGYIKRHDMEFQKGIIKKEVNKVYNLVLDAANRDLPVLKDVSEELLKKSILKRIESMKYDMDGYIFIFDYKGNILININRSLMDENQLDLRDKNGLLLTKEIIRTAQKGEGFISYMGLEGTHRDQSRKISFIKGFKKWGWAIGYGFHPGDIEPLIKEKTKELNKKHSFLVKKLILINLAVTAIFALILIWFSKNIKNIFNRYKKEILLKEEKSRQKDEIIFYQSKMASMGELINMISHQWRHPLSQINSLTMEIYIKQREGTLCSGDLKKTIRDIEKTTGHLSKTIDDFGNFFVSEKNKRSFYPKEALDECIKILSPSLKDTGFFIDLKNNKGIYGNINLYQQVLLSILSNSLDIFIQRKVKEPEIRVDIYEKGDMAVVEISDNAGGIEDKYLGRVFDLYFSTKETKNISGLGLYIAKKIIRSSFNGEIGVENSPLGAKFIIRVPCEK